MMTLTMLHRRFIPYAGYLALLILSTIVNGGEKALIEQRLEIDETWHKILIQDKILAKQGGVRIISYKDDGFVVVTVAFTTNKDQIHRREIAKTKAIKNLVAYLEGIDVYAHSSFKDTGMETIWTEKIITEVKGVIKMLPIVATWTDDSGKFYTALGAAFDADGNRLLTPIMEHEN